METLAPQEEKASDGSQYLFTFLILLAVLIFIGLGIFIGFVVWGNKSNPNNPQGQGIGADISPFPTGIQLMGDSSQATPSDGTNNWTLYTDINFSVKYPVTWLMKKGFSTKDDLVLYDPKSIKQSGQSRIPTIYIDILSVNPSTQSAQQIVDNYKTQSQQKNVTISSEQSPTFGADLVLFDGGGSSGKNVLWSHNGMLANFNTSIQHLSDNSVENQILKTFQFAPPPPPPAQQQPAQ